MYGMPSVELLFGPMLIGVFFNTILYGILVMQTFTYLQTYRKDPPWFKYFVLYLFVAETINTALDIYVIYEPLIQRYGTPRAITRAPVMLSSDAVVTVAISTPVQIFIAWRIKIISGSKLLTSFIIFLAMCSFVGGVATTVSVTLIPEFSRFRQFDGAAISWLTSSAVADIVITASLVWSLHKRKTGMGIDDLINRIIILSIQTGLITSLSASADLICFMAIPNTTLNFIWDFSLSKLYTNSLLSTLNARAGWNNLTGYTHQSNLLFTSQRTNSRRGNSSITPGVLPTTRMDIDLTPRQRLQGDSLQKITPEYNSGYM